MSEYTKADLDRIGAEWLDRIAQAEKREDGWRKDAEKAEAAYLAGAGDDSKGDVPSFNVLHSNVETIVPAIFNSSPVPDIRPRHAGSDPVAKVVSDILEKAIAAQVDDNALDVEMEDCAQDAFLAGRGIVRVRFDADEETVVVGYDADEEGNYFERTETRLTHERVLFENVSWRDYREGPAKRWDAVPWVAYRHEVSEAERERLENPEMQVERDADKDENLDCTVWEIWCKETRRVYFVVAESGTVLDIKDDPLGLKGFFPQAKPVQPIKATGKRLPVCPYTIYAALAEEVDRATRRIDAIMKGLKLRGVIAADAQVLETIQSLDDNEIGSVGNIENLVAAGGLEKAIMWWPVDKAIAVLQQLYAQREQSKQAIYEITGISDIVRGQGVASETATAQQIKTQWGSLRIKKMQKLLERQARDLFILAAEIIGRHFSPATIQRASGVPLDQQAAAFLRAPIDHYRVDVETDSTVRADLTRSRGEMTEFLRGTAEFFATMAPVVQSAPQSAGPLAEMYAAFARQFNLGKSAEDALEKFVQMAQQAATQDRPDPEAEKAKAEMEMQQQQEQNKMKLEVSKLQLQAENLRLDADIKRQELGHKRDELTLKERQAEFEAVKTAVDMEEQADRKEPRQ